MTTQPETAVGSEATPAADPADAFTKIAEEEFGVTDEVQDDEPAEGDPAEGADDEADIEEEADDLPPIDAPASWTAEDKAKFGELPRDLQETVQKREADRERFVQSKAQEAVRAKQSAVSEASAQLAQIEQGYAQHYQGLAEQIQPQRPHPSLAQTDPATFYAMQAQFEDSVAQRQQLQQQAQQFAQQAKQREAQAEQAFNAEQHQLIVEQFPEYTDPTTGPELQRKLSAVAKRIGYPDELIGQARATDIIAMRTVAEAFDKADKYDALQKGKMEKVRAAKGLPRVAKPGVSQGSDQLRASRAQAAIETARTAKNRDQAGQAFHDYLANTGQI